MKRVMRRIPVAPAVDQPRSGPRSRLGQLARVALRALAAQGHLALAAAVGGPGVGVRVRTSALAAPLLVARNASAQVLALELLVNPMDSFRYFEIPFALSAAREAGPGFRYLDVSSPRLLPALVLQAVPHGLADILNPDAADIAETRAMLACCGLAGRCRFHRATVAGANLEPEAFHLVTSVSVLEHIPDPADIASLEKVWRLLAPGGRLVLTVPCAREAFEEWIDRDPYGLGAASTNGFFFGQRFYDARLLRERVFAVCGAPGRTAILGERTRGHFFRDRDRKIAGGVPPREPLSVALHYRRYGSLEDLPGIGVVGLEFVKPGGAPQDATGDRFSAGLDALPRQPPEHHRRSSWCGSAG